MSIGFKEHIDAVKAALPKPSARTAKPSLMVKMEYEEAEVTRIMVANVISMYADQGLYVDPHLIEVRRKLKKNDIRETVWEVLVPL